MAATLTITENITGSGFTSGLSGVGPLSITLGAPIDGTGVFAATTSYAQLTVPTGASELHIFPPAANTNNIFIAGNSGDTGINCGPGASDWIKLFVLAGSSVIYIKAALATTLAYRFN